MTNQDDYKAQRLLKNYLDGNCTEEERALVEEWYLTLKDKKGSLPDEELIADLSELEQRLSKIPHQKSSKRPIYRIVSTAAAVAAVIFTVAIWPNRPENEQGNSETTSLAATDHDIMPGSNKALLSLDGGRSIELNEQQGEIVSDGSSIHYGDGSGVTDLKNAQMVTLSTPVAGQYRMTLPDGTKVWLNALSSISYPTVFEENVRQVHIKGEVYFEVARDSQRPFIVATGQQQIDVLGTSFNINAYQDNGETLTTLTEGSLRITHLENQQQVELTPGQQSIVGNQKSIKIRQVNAEEAYSWKDGLYIINNESLHQYAKKIERWYDVRMDISDGGDRRFSAIIPRIATLSEVLQAIELKTGVKFNIEERRVTIME